MKGKDGDPKRFVSKPKPKGRRLTHVKHRKILQNSTKLLVKCILCKLDLAHVEVAYSADLEILVDNLGR